MQYFCAIKTVLKKELLFIDKAITLLFGANFHESASNPIWVGTNYVKLLEREAVQGFMRGSINSKLVKRTYEKITH